MADSYQIVRLKKGKTNFEIMAAPGSVQKFRKNEVSIKDVLVMDLIFTNQSKGDKASDDQLERAFETADVKEVAKTICMKGDLQLTAAERQAKVDKKKSEIVGRIHKFYVDPKTNLPHPVARIEAAMEDCKFRVDPEASTDKQVQDLVHKMVSVIPLKKSEMEARLVLSHAHMAAAQGSVVGRYLNVKQEKYDATGCSMRVTLLPGDYDAVVKQLGKITNGDYTFEILGSELTGISRVEGAFKQDDQKKKKKSTHNAPRGGRGGSKGKRGK
eukprot:CAMPEP_0119118982 /NCGR_PEP_ID=MMETSP1310-20130426/680_1 /TAXON_ID=464262 /ORGANISM="Genus nov. species nov., Strain RCC2339" /LENGTH=270 /DNA_ID=CAMNT_0007108391 /DNA_START=81 /DNA_END=893 /DNA_ORIENTATION=+